jgi:hypothetical protein
MGFRQEYDLYTFWTPVLSVFLRPSQDIDGFSADTKQRTQTTVTLQNCIHHAPMFDLLSNG